MRWICTLFAALHLASAAAAIQEGATGAGKGRNGFVDVGTVDAGDSASGTTRVANKNTITPRRADSCSAQTDGVAGEFCLDDVGGLWQCPQASAPCNASGWQLAGTGALVPASSQALSASTQITVPASYRPFTLTPSGTTTLTATPTLAAGSRLGQIVALFNQDGTATDCAVFRDASVYASSGLSLRASSRTLCPGDGGLFLAWNGSTWEEIAPGTLRIREGTQDKGLLNQLDFASGDFDITGKVIALESSVTRLDNTIEPSETTGAFAFLNAAQVWSALQTLEAGLIVEPSLVVRKADNTAILDCGGASTNACRYTGDYSNAADTATKANVNGRYTLPVIMTSANATIGTLASRNYVNQISANTTDGLAKQTMPIACTTGTLYVRQKAAFNEGTSPTGNSITAGFRKNGSDTGAVECTMAAGVGTCTSATAMTFAAGDYFSFYLQCNNTGTACTDAGSQRGANFAFVCEAP